MRDPFARLPTKLRLWAATALCLVPFGLVWSRTPGFLSPGIVLSGNCSYVDGFCTPDPYVPGAFSPGHPILVSQSPARVFLLVGAAALIFVATRSRTHATRRVARLATGALGVAVAQAVADRATSTLVCVVLSLALVTPLVWRGSRARDVLVPDDMRA